MELSCVFKVNFISLHYFCITGKGGNKYAGGNPVCPRPTPDWQKGIGMFLSPSKTKAADKENAEPNTDIEITEVSKAG